MPEAADQILTLFNEHYGTVTAARALLGWAGGPPDLMEFTLGGPVSEFSVVREMLCDKQGDPVLLRIVEALAKERFAEAYESGPKTAAAIDVALGMSGIGNPFRAALLEFPAQSWEAAFACFVPLFEGKYTPEWREHLLNECAALTESPVAEVAQGLVAAVRATHAGE